MELEVEEKPVAYESVTPNTTSSVPEEKPVEEPPGEKSQPTHCYDDENSNHVRDLLYTERIVYQGCSESSFV